MQDTNVFVAALRSGAGASRKLLLALLQGRHLPLLGDKLWYEHLDVMGRTDQTWDECPLSPEVRRQAVEDFAAVCEWVKVWRVWRPNLSDAGDNHVMELAIVGNAAVIVTFNESDFKGAMFAPPGCEIMPPGKFLRQYPL